MVLLELIMNLQIQKNENINFHINYTSCLYVMQSKSADIEIYEDGCKKIPITKSLGLYYETSQFCTNDSLTKSIHVNFATPQPYVLMQ